MISNFNKFNELFEEIDSKLTDKVHIYVIGGAVMLYYGLKISTKDIDIIVDSKEEFKSLNKTLLDIEFTSQVPTAEYKKFDISQIFVRDDFRIDLFEKTVCKGFMLSENMRKRAKKVLSLKNLDVSLCSTTDIFMFKTFTERPGDIDDCLSLAQTEIDYSAMILEIKDQIKESGKSVWITYLGERFDLLEDKNLVIPIKKEIDKLRNDYFGKLEKELNSAK